MKEGLPPAGSFFFVPAWLPHVSQPRAARFTIPLQNMIIDRIQVEKNCLIAGCKNQSKKKMNKSNTRMLKHLACLLAVAVLLMPDADAQKKKQGTDTKTDSLKSSTFSGLKWRSIGPAMTSGRIADFAVNPCNTREYYAGVASGHVWKTENAGITWKPVFDDYGAYAIGVVTMDPGNHNVVWVGTGENNHQRAIGYGNGVWKSTDGGQSFKNMGLKESRQIGGIVIDPRNSDIVFVAAEGSIWGPGGDRGLYKSTDGGETWKKVLEISENTGVNNVVIDPRRPDIMYATSEQRRRHVFTKIGGGPESAVYKSTDGGETWRKIMKGMPKVDIGGMGIDVSPADPDVVYVIMEAVDDKGGFFKSTDRGESWDRVSSYSSSGQYYNEIYCDPNDVNVIYSMETTSKVSRDGGKTWTDVGNDGRHVDDHALWIDHSDSRHLLIGGDGGIYESFDGGKKWDFKQNLPVTQFYRVMVDNDLPFYNVYGGTQDNNTLGGPSQNTCSGGVSNEDWQDILGGDGFWVAVDPDNPDIVYCESQYGNVTRWDRRSGENTPIKPQPRKGEDTYKWNWDAPLIVSPHKGTRIYMGANKIFRSDDRGNTWKVISDDITAQIDRNTWPVMGHYWSYDAVAKDVSTSLYGMAVSLVESPVKEDLLYVGTDDGVISVTEDAGGTWRQVKSFPGIPDNTYVSDILADQFNENVVYATFNNHQRDDFKPYVLKSMDKGRTWTSISNNLPDNGAAWTLEQDFVNPELLFVGTEFGIFFSINGGGEWVALKSGLPSIAVRDIMIQKRENDLAIATFGRGFYILDDYTPLRGFRKEMLKEEAVIFPVKDAKMFIQTGSKYGQGSNFFTSDNPDYGATFTYYIKDVPRTLREARQESEKKLFKDSKPIPQPSVEQLRAEKEEIAPYLVFSIMDGSGREIRKLSANAKKGIHRITWDLKYPSYRPVSTTTEKFTPVASGGPRERGRGRGMSGMPVMPGNYSVSLSMVTREGTRELVSGVPFKAVSLNLATLPAENLPEVEAFNAKVSELAGTMAAAENFATELRNKAVIIRQTLLNMAGSEPALMNRAAALEKRLDDVMFKFDGPEAKASWEEVPPGPMPLNRRLRAIVYGSLSSSSGTTQTQIDNYGILRQELPPVLQELKSINEEIGGLNRELDEMGAPWTPGRIPDWQ
jgi:photosystem II stability/assembly factor-like uncharacterized protein